MEPALGAGFAYQCLYPPLALMRLAAESMSDKRFLGTIVLPPVIVDTLLARMISALFDTEGGERLARETRLLALLAR